MIKYNLKKLQIESEILPSLSLECFIQLSLDRQKDTYGMCTQQRLRPDCASEWTLRNLHAQNESSSYINFTNLRTGLSVCSLQIHFINKLLFAFCILIISNVTDQRFNFILHVHAFFHYEIIFVKMTSITESSAIIQS